MEPEYRYTIQYLYAKSNKTQFNGQLDIITSFSQQFTPFE